MCFPAFDIHGCSNSEYLANGLLLTAIACSIALSLSLGVAIRIYFRVKAFSWPSFRLILAIASISFIWLLQAAVTLIPSTSVAVAGLLFRLAPLFTYLITSLSIQAVSRSALNLGNLFEQRKHHEYFIFLVGASPITFSVVAIMALLSAIAPLVSIGSLKTFQLEMSILYPAYFDIIICYFISIFGGTVCKMLDRIIKELQVNQIILKTSLSEQNVNIIGNLQNLLVWILTIVLGCIVYGAYSIFLVVKFKHVPDSEQLTSAVWLIMCLIMPVTLVAGTIGICLKETILYRYVNRVSAAKTSAAGHLDNPSKVQAVSTQETTQV